MRCPECGALAAQEQTEADHAYALLESAEARIETLQNALLAERAKNAELVQVADILSDIASPDSVLR